MNMWKTLDIEPTTDKRTIKRAYAKMAARYHPEEQPEKFQQLYDAYEQALSYAERYAGRQYPKAKLSYDEDTLDEDVPSTGHDTFFKPSESIDFGRTIPKTPREEPAITDNDKDNTIDFDEMIPKTPKQQLTLKADASNDNQMDFKQLLAPAKEKEGRRLSPKQHTESTINFEAIVKDEDFDEPQHEKEPNLNGKKDGKKKSRPRDIMIYLFIWFFLCGIMRIFSGGTISFFSDLEDELPGQEQVKRILEQKYDIVFEITPIDIPDNLNGIYYLVEEGKEKEDYEWFECQTMGAAVSVSFYASLNDSGDIKYDYSYKQLFAFISHVGLGGYLDMEEVQKGNLQYLHNGEKKYCYPVIKLSSGSINNHFFEQLTKLSDMIQESDAQFHSSMWLIINIKNADTGDIYHFRIEEGEKPDMQKTKEEIRALFRI